MIKEVIKDGIVKEIDNESLLADYICAGWKIKEDEKNLIQNKGTIR